MKSIIKRIGDAWRCCLHGVVGWWRRITGRDRYYMGYDPAYESDKAAWCICRVDTKTGVTTVLESGMMAKGVAPEVLTKSMERVIRKQEHAIATLV